VEWVLPIFSYIFEQFDFVIAHVFSVSLKPQMSSVLFRRTLPQSIINTVDGIAEITILKMLLKKSIIAESLDQFADIMRRMLD